MRETTRWAFMAGLVLAGGLLLAACGGPATAPQGDAGAGKAATAPQGDAGGSEAKDESEDEAREEAKGDPAKGEQLFGTTCASCHGPDAKGLPKLGKNLHANAFLAGLTDDEALTFVKTGRPASDPLNTTKVDMPPKGGNPALSDEDIHDIIAYVRTLKE